MFYTIDKKNKNSKAFNINVMKNINLFEQKKYLFSTPLYNFMLSEHKIPKKKEKLIL